MRALDRKLWRDLADLKGQATAIILVLLCGVATWVMFIATLDSLQATRADYYSAYRFADVFASLKRAPETLRPRIEALPGVAAVETRVVAPANLDIADFPEPVTGLVISVPDHGQQRLNALLLREGRYIEPFSNDDIIVSEPFAEAHGLAPGDRLHAVINGRRSAFTVVGIALSPEYVYQIRPGGLFPDYERFGVMWMGRDALARAFDMDGAFNDVVLGLAPGASEAGVIGRLDALLERYGGLGAIGREDQASHRFLQEELAQLGNLSRIFPVIFLGVAVFLLNVVLSRLVALQREQIATLKAFGYANGEIVWHYLKLVSVIVLAGVGGGIVFGTWLGRWMAGVYREFFRFPYLAFEVNAQTMIEAALASLGAAALGTVFSVYRAARINPAQAMQPEPPASYRTSLVERLGLGRVLTQPDRMILRNIGRYPLKATLSIAGIAVAAAITMTSNFQGDTVRHLLSVQFNMLQREDIGVVFAEPTSYRARFELAALDGVRLVEVHRSVPVELRHGHRTWRTSIRGMEQGSDIQRVLDVDHEPIDLPAEGILVTDYLGELLGAGVGDRLVVQVLEGARPQREVTVAGLVREYLGLSAYMERQALNRFMREGPAISGAWLAVDDPDHLPRIYRRLNESPRVSGVVLRKEEMANFDEMLDQSLLYYTFVASIFSVVIAFGVVYNSARIALAERSRELASLRVLGFTRAEISYILLGELGLLTLIALPFGFFAGWFLTWLIARNLQSELYRFPLVLEPGSYALAALVVIFASIVSALVVRRRLDRLDLVGVLKARE